MAAPTKKRTARPAAPSRRQPAAPDAKKAFDDSMDRLSRAIDAAEAAAKDLRSGVDRGRRDLVRDLERTLRNARTNARRVGKAIPRDIEQAMRADASRGRSTAGASRSSGSARSRRSG